MEFTNRLWCSIHPSTFLSTCRLFHLALTNESSIPVAFVQAIRSQVLMNSNGYFLLLGIVPINFVNSSNDSQGDCGSIIEVSHALGTITSRQIFQVCLHRLYLCLHLCPWYQPCCRHNISWGDQDSYLLSQYPEDAILGCVGLPSPQLNLPTK